MNFLLVVAVFLTISSSMVNARGQNDGMFGQYVLYGDVCYDQKLNETESACLTRRSDQDVTSIISVNFENVTDGSTFYLNFCCANSEYNPIQTNEDDSETSITCDTNGDPCSDQGLTSTKGLTSQPTAAPVNAPTHPPSTEEAMCVGFGCKGVPGGEVYSQSRSSRSGLRRIVSAYFCCPGLNESRIEAQWESGIVVGSCFVPNDVDATCPVYSSATRAYDFEGGDGLRPPFPFPRDEDEEIPHEVEVFFIVLTCLIALVIICLCGTFIWFCCCRSKKTMTNEDPMSASPLKSQDPVEVI